MSRSLRPNVSIYNYPEHLNPFHEDTENSQNHREAKSKDSKHKFWTFGRSRKKRSNSFSIKSTWSGLFGKRKEASDAAEKRSTITTVSSTYKKDPCIPPPAPARVSRDQQEFEEALGTLARRRKYTLENSSRYSSSLTVNGDPARIYDGSPQDTTTSILGELTPKPPARRFGQVSPKPTDKIPPLDYGDREPKENGEVTLREKHQEKTPVPPLRRFGNRSSQRLNVSNTDEERLRDENENVPEDYVFKRFTQDAVRRSNLSINSCISVGSTTSGYSRKKRRAPPPPVRKEKLETPEENVAQTTTDTMKIELQITEPIDITRVTENIDEMTKKSNELSERSDIPSSEENEKQGEASKEANEEVRISNESTVIESSEKTAESKVESSKEEADECNQEKSEEKIEDNDKDSKDNIVSDAGLDLEKEAGEQEAEKGVEEVQVEYHRTSQENLEIIKDVDVLNSELDEVCLRKKGSTNSLSRSDSFSVKEEIEKIEKQIKELESKNASQSSSQENDEDLQTTGRQSLQANRRHFFQDMVDTEDDKGIKIEFKELPREQKDIHVVRLVDPPVPVVTASEPVKVIELHISEPIKQKAEILDDVNPIPKPRRHSALNLNSSVGNNISKDECNSSEPSDKRGKSF